MSAITQQVHRELEQDQALRDAINRALDFSELHASIERAERLLDMARRLLDRDRRTIDPDAVDMQTPPVSEWQDERNSRPEPY